MKVIVLGLGYVGMTTAVCLAELGHTIVGIDIDKTKVERIKSGISPIKEPGIQKLLTKAQRESRLVVDIDILNHVKGADLALISIGTPINYDGHLNIDHVRDSVLYLAQQSCSTHSKDKPLLIVIRSTLNPGDIESTILPSIMSKIKPECQSFFTLATNPEFLREGRSVSDFFNPAKIVIGEAYNGETQELMGLYESIDAPIFSVSYSVAELIKVLDNNFHALKVSFGNEIGRLCRKLGIDHNEVMRPFLADTKLNISTKYLSPGSPFGGSCLPKDVKSLQTLSNKLDLRLPVIENILESNNEHIRYLSDLMVDACQGKRCLLYGLSFKDNTDDLRSSPFPIIVKNMLLNNIDVKAYDPDIEMSSTTGVNLNILQELIHALGDRLLTSLPELGDYDVIILTKKWREILHRLEQKEVISLGFS